MELKQFDTVAACEKGRELTIKDVEGIETDIVFKIVGVDSKVYRTENAKLQAKLKLAEKRGRELELDEVEAEWCRVLAKCTLGWNNFTKDGEPIPFSEAKAAEIYEGYPLIKAQVFAALFDRAAFLGNFVSAS
jgi:hypothetical protein